MSALGERRAVIDVGTNSVKLMVADVGVEVRPVLKMSRQTRLGQGAFHTKRLRSDAIARTAAAVAELASRADELEPTGIRVLATCATRETTNGGELVQAIKDASGLTVEIVSGQQEARLVFQGVTSDPALTLRRLLIVDVGGGSTEWVLGERGFIRFAASTLLGTSRLLELDPPADPPTRVELTRYRANVAAVLARQVRPRLEPVLNSFGDRGLQLVGLGGALKTLAHIGSRPSSGGQGDPPCLQLDDIGERLEWLWSLSSAQRRRLEGLDPEKADVILAGAVIYEAVMRVFGFAQLLVSQRGLREGALLDQAQFAHAAKPFRWPGLQWSSAAKSWAPPSVGALSGA